MNNLIKCLRLKQNFVPNFIDIDLDYDICYIFSTTKYILNKFNYTSFTFKSPNEESSKYKNYMVKKMILISFIKLSSAYYIFFFLCVEPLK